MAATNLHESNILFNYYINTNQLQDSRCCGAPRRVKFLSRSFLHQIPPLHAGQHLSTPNLVCFNVKERCSPHSHVLLSTTRGQVRYPPSLVEPPFLLSPTQYQVHSPPHIEGVSTSSPFTLSPPMQTSSLPFPPSLHTSTTTTPLASTSEPHHTRSPLPLTMALTLPSPPVRSSDFSTEPS